MNKPETEYYLGRNDRNGYTIVEHNSRRPPYEGCCVFGISDYWISDGDGTPMKYDDTYVEIEEDVRKHAMRMFRDVERKLVLIGNESSTPIEGNVKVGNYLYSRGEYYHVISLHQGHELFESFYCDKYDLDFDPNPFSLEELGTTLEELMEDSLLISKETYETALQIARIGITQITEYLSDQYIRHKGIESTNL